MKVLFLSRIHKTGAKERMQTNLKRGKICFGFIGKELQQHDKSSLLIVSSSKTTDKLLI